MEGRNRLWSHLKYSRCIPMKYSVYSLLIDSGNKAKLMCKPLLFTSSGAKKLWRDSQLLVWTTNSVEISKYVLRVSREYRYWSFSCFTFAFDIRSRGRLGWAGSIESSNTRNDILRGWQRRGGGVAITHHANFSIKSRITHHASRRIFLTNHASRKKGVSTLS